MKLNQRIASLFVLGLVFMSPTLLQAEDDEKMHVNAAIDLSPLAQKLNELGKLSVLTTSIVREQVGKIAPAVIAANAATAPAIAALDKTLKANHEAQMEKLDGITTALQELKEALPKEPVAYDYQILRSQSENGAKELGAKGWVLITATKDGWLVFQKSLFTKPAGGLGAGMKPKAE